MLSSKVYPLYIQKAERKGRTRHEVDRVVCWLALRTFGFSSMTAMNHSSSRNAALRPRRVFRLPRLFSALPLLALVLCMARTVEARPNVLFISIDDLRNDLGVLGASHARTPHLDSFAQSARVFRHHYVQVPTCGASRRVLMRARYPDLPAHLGNETIRQDGATWAADSLPGIFRTAGYETLSLGKITHYPGNRTGRGWAEGPEELPGVWDRAWVPEGPWRSPEAMMHGYANGAPRIRGQSPPYEAFDGPDDAYPDAWVAADAVATLGDLAKRDRPWFFAVGFFKPHLPFAAPRKWHDLHAGSAPALPAGESAKPDWPSGWHGSAELRSGYLQTDQYDPSANPGNAIRMRESYAAAISYMDAQVGRVLRALGENGFAENTIVIVWSDHGFLLGEHGIWGKHCLYEPALRSPLMIRTPAMAHPGAPSDALVETVDVLPTLADLCGLPVPAGVNGCSLRPQLNEPAAPSGKAALGFWTGGLRTIRTERWRLIVQPGFKQGTPRVELFDYQTDPGETRNHADRHPGIVADLLRQIDASAPPVREGS